MPWILSTKLCRGSDDVTVGGTSIILFIFGMDPTKIVRKTNNNMNEWMEWVPNARGELILGD